MQRFSVLMSVYFRERPAYLRCALDSVFAQTIPPSEVVLVEDGPLTEELEKVIATFSAAHSELKIIRLPQNGGLGRALNEGLKHCSYELVARMDSDDICKPDRFEKQLKVFEANPCVDICSAWVDEFEANIDSIVSQRRLPEHHDRIVDFAKTRCPINHPAVMYRKSKVTSAGGYRGFPEDAYLWVRMIQNANKFYNIQESLLWFRTSKETYKRRGGWKYAKDDLRAQWNFYKIGFLSFPEFVRNSVIRGTVRLMPNRLRVWVYNRLLRKRGSPA